MGRHDEKRKHTRVPVEGIGSMLSGLEVQLQGVGPVELFDISYGGAAFSQPPDQRISLSGQKLELDFFMNGKKVMNVTAKTVRLTEEMFATEFLDTSSEVKGFVDRLITNRMVGLNMNLIDPQFYKDKNQFSYWFHGPKNTNLYLWEEDGQLTRATLDLFNIALHWQDGMFQVDNKMARSIDGGPTIQGAALGEGAFRQAAEILSQMRTNISSLEEFKKMVFDRVLEK